MKILNISILLFALSGFVSFGNSDAKLNRYTFTDTKITVLFVEQAASLVEQNGAKKASAIFSRQGSVWQNKKYHLFIYDSSGKCIFHSGLPMLVGKNVLGLKDFTGRQIIKAMIDVGKSPQKNASGWFSILGEGMDRFAMEWRIAYARKVVSPDGKVYLVGVTTNSLKIEQVLVEEIVDLTVREMLDKGAENAFESFKKEVFKDVYITVMDEQGCLLLSPLNPYLSGQNITDFQDASGRFVVREILEKLKNTDRIWLQYSSKPSGSFLPLKKLIYERKITMPNGKTYIIGLDYYAINPIWLK